MKKSSKLKNLIKIETSKGSVDYYQYNWHISKKGFEAAGILGQILYVYP